MTPNLVFGHHRLFIASVTLMLSACGGSSSTSAAGAGGGGYGGTPGPTTTSTPDLVTATPAITFDPASLTTQVGHAVTFAFGGVGHNVFFSTKPGAPADIPGTNANTSIGRMFAVAGTYPYTCHIHPQMSGTIIVQ